MPLFTPIWTPLGSGHRWKISFRNLLTEIALNSTDTTLACGQARYILDHLPERIDADLKKRTYIEKIFDAIESYSDNSEIRYVGGCVRKIINNENVDDIDLAPLSSYLLQLAPLNKIPK